MRVLALSLLLFSVACSRLPETLRPYADAAPQSLLAEIDERIYSPIAEGLKTLEADLMVDVTGFFPPKARPAKPVWIPVNFSWRNGRARFDLPELPAPIQPLKDRLFQTLQGKDEDIVYRPFSERLAGMQLSVAPTDEGLLRLTAREPETKLTWGLLVDDRLLVPAIAVGMPDGRSIDSRLTYDDNGKARISRIDSVYGGEQQDTEVTVELRDYRETDGIWLPRELVYTGGVGKVRFPPLTLRLRNVSVTRN